MKSKRDASLVGVRKDLAFSATTVLRGEQVVFRRNETEATRLSSFTAKRFRGISLSFDLTNKKGCAIGNESKLLHDSDRAAMARKGTSGRCPR